MSKTVKTFGYYLRHFARTVDIVDERTIEDIRKLIYDYVEDELGIAYFSLATRHSIDGRSGLQTMWSTDGGKHATTISNQEGEYSSQISVSFGRSLPLWVVNPAQKSLRQSDEYVDMWSGVEGLPKYQAPINRDMKTSIIVPLIHQSVSIGVIYLESTSYLEITQVAIEELSLLADTLAILFDLRAANEAQMNGTRDAISELQSLLKFTKFPRLTKPQLFVASSSRADEAVIGIVQEVLNEFSDLLMIVQWNRIDQSGAITLQLIEEISKSRFGICYFSEPARGAADDPFEDNPNVLFEAGMLHSLTNSPVGQPMGWIPIREGKSPKIPFDFASERIQIVPRTANGEIMEERFRESLRRRIKSLLSEAVAD